MQKNRRRERRYGKDMETIGFAVYEVLVSTKVNWHQLASIDVSWHQSVLDDIHWHQLVSTNISQHWLVSTDVNWCPPMSVGVY